MTAHPLQIRIAVEDELSEMVVRRILDDCNTRFQIVACHRKSGIGYLQKQTNSFNLAAVHIPFLMLMDLDRAACPATLIEKCLTHKQHPNFLFRVAVREVESWLLADRGGLARFLGVSQALFPQNPDQLIDPKLVLINIARKSRRRNIRENVVPATDFNSIGPGYNSTLTQFVMSGWHFRSACKHSESLMRFCRRVDEFRPVPPNPE